MTLMKWQIFVYRNKTIVSSAMWHPHYHYDYFKKNLFPIDKWPVYIIPKVNLHSICFFWFFVFEHFTKFFFQFEILILTNKNTKLKLLTVWKLFKLHDKYWSCHIFDWVKWTPLLLYSFNSWLLSIYIIFFSHHKTCLEDERHIWIWILQLLNSHEPIFWNKWNPIINNLEVIASYKKLSKICLQADVDFDQTVC